jgi:hypothetical protein
MSLTTYCSYDEVRSALGVNDLELKDSVLALPVYEMGLLRELSKLSTALNAAFSVVAAVAPGDRTAQQTALYEACHLFSVYTVAKQVGVSLPTFAVKDVSDGKASVSRFAGEPFKATLAAIDEYLAGYKVDLKAAFETFNGAGTTLARATVGTVASPRSYDPVTG